MGLSSNEGPSDPGVVVRRQMGRGEAFAYEHVPGIFLWKPDSDHTRTGFCQRWTLACITPDVGLAEEGERDIQSP